MANTKKTSKKSEPRPDGGGNNKPVTDAEHVQHSQGNAETANPGPHRHFTRDPNMSGGVIVESGDTDDDGNPVTTAGSTHLTTCIEGKWRVCNARGEPLSDKEYDTESEAVEAAQKENAKRVGE